MREYEVHIGTKPKVGLTTKRTSSKNGCFLYKPYNK